VCSIYRLCMLVCVFITAGPSTKLAWVLQQLPLNQLYYTEPMNRFVHMGQ